MREFITELLSISVIMAAVIAFLLSVSVGMKSNFSARARYIVWLLVMIRLAVPFGGMFFPSLIEIPVSQTPADTKIVENTEPKEETDKDLGISQPDTPVKNPVETVPAANNETENSPIVNDMQEMQGEKEPSVDLKPNEPVAQTGEEKSFEITLDLVFGVAFGVWAVGAVSFIAKNLIAYTVFTAKSKKNLKEAKGEMLETYKALCESVGIRRSPKLYINAVNESPYCAGYFRKRIVVPDMAFSQGELCDVLSHELCHHRRGDVWMKLLSVAANAVHWFNPLVYMAVERFDRELEHCCDETVLRGKSEEEALAYGKNMLSVARECKGGIALTTRFNPKKKAVGERIDNILDTGKKKKRGIIIICAVAVLCIASGIIIGVKVLSNEEPEKEPEETKKSENVSVDGYPVVLWSNDDGVKLCAKTEEDKKGGENIPLVLLAGDDVISFNGNYIFHVDSRSKYYNTDITGDGVKDHVLILPIECGTGVSEEELYAFNGKDLTEIPVEDPLAFINSQMTFTGDDDYYYVRHYGNEIFKLTKKALTEFEEGWMLEKPLVDSGINYYNVTENENGASSITVEYFVSIAKGNFGFLGDAVVSFSCTGKELKCKEVSFVPYEIATTNDESWTVRGYNSTVVITNGDTTVSLNQDNGLENFHSHYSNDTLTATFDKEGKQCVLTYYDRSSWSGPDEEVHMMRAALVNLEEGKVVAEFAPTFQNILSYNRIPSDDELINGYLEDDVRLSHTLSVYPISDGRFQIYSDLNSDDYRITLKGSVVVSDSNERFVYTILSPVIPDKTGDVFEILDELRDMEYVPSKLATAATAFVNKDTVVLESHLGCMYGVLESYKDFEFGDYSLSYSDGVLELHIEIKKSSLNAVPTGDYTIEFQDGRWGAVSMSGIGVGERTDKDTVATLAQKYTKSWIGIMPATDENYCCDLSVVEKVNESDYENLQNDILKYLNYCNSELNTPDEYKEFAKKILGLANLHIPDSMIDDAGNVELWGHGGFIRMYEVLPETRENGIIKVKVQLYADFSRTVESHVYEFSYEDHGDYLRLVSIEQTYKSKYEPEDRYVS